MSQLNLFSTYAPHAAQLKFHNNGSRWLAAVAGARGGKTLAGAVEFIRRCVADMQAGRVNDCPATGPAHRRPRWHGWILAPTYQLLDEPRRRLFEFVPPSWIEDWNVSRQALWLKGGALVELRSAEDPTKLVSVGLQGAWMDEVARIKAEAWRGGVRMRLADHKGWCIATTTPMGRTWIYDDWIDKVGKDPEYGVETWPTIANPYFDYREVIAAKRDLPRRYFEREFEASAVAWAGKILDEFNPLVHVLSANEWMVRTGYRAGSIPLKRTIAGIDWGFSSPTSIVVIGMLTDGTLVMLDEVYEVGLRPVHDDPKRSIVNICNSLRDKYGVSQFFCDSADPGAIHDLVRSGINATPAYKNIADGIRAMCRAFRVANGQPRMYVLDHCRNFIREASTWQWATTKDGGAFLEEPAPGQIDHALDAARYALVDLLGYDQDPHRRVRYGGAAHPWL